MIKLLKYIFWVTVILSTVQQDMHAAGIGHKAAMGTTMVVGGIVVAYVVVKLIQHFSAFYFPKPKGPFGVGTEIHQLENSVHQNQTTQDDTTSTRDLTIQFWYPTQKKASRAATPLSPELVMHYKKILPLLNIYGFYTVYTHAQPHAPIAQAKEPYPIIIYSHGGMQLLGDNASLCEELASQGYIVVGIGHPQENFLKALSTGCCDHTELANQEIELRVTEAQRVIDYLETLNQQPTNSMFFGHLNLQQIGMAGHSIGGATAVQLCRRDDRCKACVNMDGSLVGKNITAPFSKPLMLLLGGETIKMMSPVTEEEKIKRFGTKEIFVEVKKYYLEAFETLMKNMGTYVHKIIIPGAGHNTFCDLSLLRYHSTFTRFKELGTGDLNGYRAHEIINSYICAFFDKHLKKQATTLLDIGNKGKI